MRNGEDFSYVRGVLPIVYQLMAVKKNSFPEMESSGSIVVNILDICAYKRSEKIGDSSQMATSVPILEEQSK
ncbi:hypothetical protein Tco_0105759 [Tanacetum coccineum]|uniref:Uncharacterized protein n=1 Tax=Tanacetum coccineum TaxID=301880 RepID=A0ABQ5G0R2_9ASTR